MGTFGITSITSSGYGIDVQAVVEQILYAERAPVRLWQAQQTTLNSQAAALRDINSKLLDLKTKVDALKDNSGQFSAKTASSSNTEVVIATASAAAAVATHTLTITALAVTSSYYSDQLASEDTTFSTGSFSLKVGTADAVVITVTESENTPATLAAHINNDYEEETATGTLTLTANAAEGETVTVGSTTYRFTTSVTNANDVLIGSTTAESLENLAAAINHGSGEGTTYGTGTVANEEATATSTTETTLVLEALEAGAAGNSIATTETLAAGSFGAATLTGGQDDLGVTAYVITDAGGVRLSIVADESGAAGDLTISINTTGLSFTKAATGTNASLTIDGVPISSASNTAEDVIEGLTFTLLDTSATAVTVAVTPDTTKARAAINAFVASYNSVIQAINTQFTFNTSTQSGGPLSGDATLRIVQQQLLSAVSYTITGNNGYNSLYSIGLSLDDDGTLTVDTTTLDEALTDDFSYVQNLFQSTFPSGLAQNFSSDLDELTDTIDGPLNIALKGTTDATNALTEHIEAFEVRLAIRQQQLTEQFSRVDILLRQLPLMLAEINSQLSALQ